jgi:guanylate kinase
MLRKNMTPAEIAVWRELKARQHLVGVNFKPQIIVEGYIPDFSELRTKTLVEIDGSIHLSRYRRRKDRVRQSHLESHGYKVLRYTNDEVQQHCSAVVSAILHETSMRIAGMRYLQSRQIR